MTLDEAIKWLQTSLVQRALSPFVVFESNTSRVACAKLIDTIREFMPTAYILFLDKSGEPVLCDCTESNYLSEVVYNFVPIENLKPAFRGSSSWRQSTWYLNSPPIVVADWYRANGWRT